MKYTVQTRYEDFVFDDGSTAMSVAELLAANSTENIDIKIVVSNGGQDDE